MRALRKDLEANFHPRLIIKINLCKKYLENHFSEVKINDRPFPCGSY